MIPAYDQYAPYIWACYGVALAALAALAVWAWMSYRRADRLASRLEEEARK